MMRSILTQIGWTTSLSVDDYHPKLTFNLIKVCEFYQAIIDQLITGPDSSI